jgi:hypothetical protein
MTVGIGRTRGTCLAAASVAVPFWLVYAGAAHAHHGVANFDLNKDIALEGVITSVEFVNPHSWLHFDVRASDGSVTHMRCEMRGATVLMRSGWSPGMFKAGDAIKITGSPDRRDPTACYLSTASFADGSSLDRYGQRQLAPAAAAPTSSKDRLARLPNGDPNIAGDWAGEQRVMTDPRGQKGTLVPLSTAKTYAPGDVPAGGQAFPGARGTAVSLADDPVDTYWNKRGSILPLTPAGTAAIAGLDLSTADNPRLDCRPTNILFDWTFETDINRITQSPTEIKMLYGSMGIERTIHLDLREHPTSIAPSVAGHSIGRWEDDVLVVDTVGFAPGILSADGRLPHSGGLHVVERFAFDPTKRALERDYVAEDPAFFTGQFKGSDTVYVSDLPYHGTTPCKETEAREAKRAAAAAPASAAASAAAATPKPAEKPWWMFWK